MDKGNTLRLSTLTGELDLQNFKLDFQEYKDLSSHSSSPPAPPENKAAQ